MKYHNKKIIIDGITFDSIKEGKRYNELKLLQKAHIIRDLELQKSFELQPKYINSAGQHIRAITYVADFYYYSMEENKYVVEDVKSIATQKDKTYIIKKKLFMYKYDDILFKEVI